MGKIETRLATNIGKVTAKRDVICALQCCLLRDGNVFYVIKHKHTGWYFSSQWDDEVREYSCDNLEGAMKFNQGMSEIVKWFDDSHPGSFDISDIVEIMVHCDNGIYVTETIVELEDMR